ncbi:GIY-YIG nuclease family protein [Agromyces albus]|uniref:GIY-YIG nuclease family protein n=1 Tax=Agromyces albus TaxID=205332 RepID=UPI0019D6FD67|nr:GIY-YIG nuclease family protein [Agromyces albus]
MSRCGIVLADGHPCLGAVDADAPLNLCNEHLLVAYDWVARDAGVVDLLPSPCLACGSRIGVRYPSGWLCAECEWRVGDIPDDEFERPRVEVVYYIRYRDQIKIGTSANPRLRLAGIPHDVVLAFERGGRALERRRHEQFAAHRYPGTEWFAVHDALLAHLAEVGVGVDDPWLEYERWRLRQSALRG